MKVLGLQPGNARSTNGLSVGASGVFARGAGNPGASGPTPVSDPDAQAFLTAAGIVDPTVRNAINTYCIDLKGYSLWTLIVGLWPFVGATADSHKYNLKDPRDLDAAYRITWEGSGFTHAANGVTSSGSAGTVARTHVQANTAFSGSNQHIGVYQTDSTTTFNDMCGCLSWLGGAPYTVWVLGVHRATAGGQILYYDGDSTPAGQVTANGVPTSVGFTVGTRTAPNNAKVYKNGSLLATQTGSPVIDFAGLDLRLGVFGSIYKTAGSETIYPCGGRLSLFTTGYGLSDTQATNFYTATQALQTALGR